MEFNNKTKYIEKLLEKYLEATTTVAEEQELKIYFSKEDVAPHLLEYKMMFGYFSVAKEERFTKNVPLEPKKRHVSRKWITVAAVAAISFGAFFGVDLYHSMKEQREAGLAYTQTKEAFELLALNLKKGKEQMMYLNELEETKEKIFKTVNN
ncbi:hypothetical protein NBRC110019_07090 [Neptunitalea chrysea]|uniref:Uncharacterized protein n=1 Tax=Neptunitalea chrysea TaxID=1647581 RepID=A0A9W6B3H5_9FLAO|nr:hypothetical protein [Neptunitalea chrysea]GLB51670.1 hypothetical protein NBRC110019_07090 [Neptunitalea chrysea]